MQDFEERDLDNLQKLCRIRLNEEEKKAFLLNLQKILSYMDQLNEIATENVPACTYVLKDMQRSVMREDLVTEHLSREEFLSNAPDQIGGMIRIPPVMKS